MTQSIFNFNELETQNDGEILSEKSALEPKALTVSQLNSKIRFSLEGEYKNIWLQGEISNFKPHSSGHFYFSLKDDSSQINAIMFKGQNSKLKFKPENGMEVLVRGRITLYEPRGQYSINCETMEPVGAGALQKAFEQLKAKLQAEGLFAQERKKPLPKIPKHIGLVTSPTGAAIKDILNVLKRRHPSARITLAPAIVQGDSAPASIVSALQMIDQVKDIDVVIVGRGGGSIEDLWCFNDESVARTIAHLSKPTISAVGHEIDFTIADFVADLRAPTPSAAAELVSQSIDSVLESLRNFEQRLLQSVRQFFINARRELKNLSSRLVDPQRYLQDLLLRSDELTTRLEAAIERYLDLRRTQVELARQRMGSPLERIVRRQNAVNTLRARLQSLFESRWHKKSAYFQQLISRLQALNPLDVLQRGYSVVTKNEKIIMKASQLKVKDNIDIQLAEGKVLAEVKNIK